MQELSLEEIRQEEESPDTFEVEAIKGIREVNSKKEYYIKWKGYPNSDNTWEPEENLNCADAIADYIRRTKIREFRRRLLSGCIL